VTTLVLVGRRLARRTGSTGETTRRGVQTKPGDQAASEGC
jgi:hypothetical protein